MSRKLRRTPDFEIVLEVKNDQFIAPPRDSQRNALLNKAMAEFADDLNQVHRLAARFVPGQDTLQVQERTHTDLTDDDIMEDWQIPLMRAMAAVATESHGDLLEIGFGRGVSAGIIQEMGVRSHTIVECNESVIERFHSWKAGYPGKDIPLLEGRWQDVTDQFSDYDAIFFHTYPLNEEDYIEQAANSATFAEHFFPTASRFLRPGGVFTYMTNEIDSLSRGHQRALLRYFSSFSVQLQSLHMPVDVRDTWWADSMVIVRAVK
jgi:guanidinoacetate N-methyltransferase